MKMLLFMWFELARMDSSLPFKNHSNYLFCVLFVELCYASNCFKEPWFTGKSKDYKE